MSLVAKIVSFLSSNSPLSFNCWGIGAIDQNNWHWHAVATYSMYPRLVTWASSAWPPNGGSMAAVARFLVGYIISLQATGARPLQ